jgi:hypothetical protein
MPEKEKGREETMGSAREEDGQFYDCILIPIPSLSSYPSSDPPHANTNFKQLKEACGMYIYFQDMMIPHQSCGIECGWLD